MATTRGDDGTTGLLFGGERISKDDPRAEAYGTVDEAIAALGLARASIGAVGAAGANPGTTGAAPGTTGAAPGTTGAAPGTTGAGLEGLGELILRFQRELFVVGAELATNPAAWDRLKDGRTRTSAEMVAGVERILVETEASIQMPTEFVVPGETQTSAALELARTILRRAERRAVTLRHDGLVPGEFLVPYLNRLADLIWVLARCAEQAESRVATPANIATLRGPAARDIVAGAAPPDHPTRASSGSSSQRSRTGGRQ
ncbi:MAG: ATP:cob(I)alamin adenosyltransferase [Chloroflexota bacterium]